MLFYAIGEKRLSALEAQKGVNYSCPECGGVVRLRGGPIRQLHFYHGADASSCRSSGKSATHLRLQRQLALLICGQIEERFPTIGRIADVYSPSKNLIVEVQCSSISIEEMERRNRDYASLGLRVVWVLLNTRFSRHYFSFPHYFTNGRIFYDRFGKLRLPIDFSQEIPLPRKLPEVAKYRTLSFFGDLTHLAIEGLLTAQKRPLLRSIFHFALEVLTQ